MRTDGFSLVELLVVIAIVSIIAAIVFPVFSTAREKARSIVCGSNMREITLGILLYADDYDDRCPLLYNGYAVTPGSRNPPFYTNPDTGPNQYWPETVSPYIQRQKSHDFSTASRIFFCPSDNRQLPSGQTLPALSYGLSDNWLDWYCPSDCNSGTGQAHSFSEAVTPSSTVLLAETLTDTAASDPAYALALTPIDGGNVGYAYHECDLDHVPAFDSRRMFVVMSWRHVQNKAANCAAPPPGARINVTYADGHLASRTLSDLSNYRQWSLLQGNGDVGCFDNVDGEHRCWYP